jgi:hypothetical protein
MIPKIALFTLGFFLFSMPQAPTEPERAEDKLARHVSHYNVDSLNFVEALVHVSNDFQIPMGIDWIEGATMSAPTSFTWDDVPLQKIVQDIADTQRCRVTLRDGVLRVTPSAPIPDQQNFLKSKIALFAVRDSYIEVASWKLHALVSPIKGNQQVSIGGSGDSRVSLEMKQASVEDILDALVVASKRKIWIVTFADDSGVTPRGFRRVVSLWSDRPGPDPGQPAWDLMRWGDPVPSTLLKSARK